MILRTIWADGAIHDLELGNSYTITWRGYSPERFDLFLRQTFSNLTDPLIKDVYGFIDYPGGCEPIYSGFKYLLKANDGSLFENLTPGF